MEYDITDVMIDVEPARFSINMYIFIYMYKSDYRQNMLPINLDSDKYRLHARCTIGLYRNVNHMKMHRCVPHIVYDSYMQVWKKYPFLYD